MNDHITGRQYWRSLEALAGSPEVQRALESEFPSYDPEEMKSNGLSRRRFLQFMGASMALAGLTLSGCRRWPKEELAPYSAAPRDRIPGVPEQYATVMNLGGVGLGLLATSFDGRPIKIEGNPSHPWSLGATDALAQASVLELYDPDRSRFLVNRTGRNPRRATWDEFAEFARKHFEPLKASGGAGLAILSEIDSSPAVADMKARLFKIYPQLTWYEYEPINRDNEREALPNARPILHLDKAAIIACFDEDLFGRHPGRVKYAHDFATRRRSADQGFMSRLYVAESTYSITGAAADGRLPVRASEVGLVLAQVARGLGISTSQPTSKIAVEYVDKLVKDLDGNHGAAVVVVGGDQPPEAHALAAAINNKIGAVGQTINYVKEPDPAENIVKLNNEMKAGRVQTLLILGGNPVYDAPADLDFAAAIAKVPLSIHLSLYNNETSLQSTWHLPRSHWLESWGTGRAWDGTITIAQPLIEPLYNGKSAIELLAIIAGDSLTDGHAILRRALAIKAWRKSLHDGLVDGSAYAPAEPKIEIRELKSVSAAPFEVRFLPSSVYDGRFANNGWLQELPDAITKITWDNAAIVSKPDADTMKIKTGDVLAVTVGGRTVEIAAYVLPGQPKGVIALPLGYGRTAAGHVGNGVGVSTYSLRTSSAMAFAPAEVKPTGRTYALAMTQDHHLIDEVGMKIRAERVGEKGKSGKIIKEMTLAEVAAHSAVKLNTDGTVSLQLFEPPSKYNNPHAWGMSIDMTACVGCNACVVACQAENNIPIVGKEQVGNGREMHWLRIDRYFKGDPDESSPEVTFQPMMCVHCENAPCEQVCPVGATMHDTEGLNTMVYNRCVGTRYCSNNCPYKVRRFNYLDWQSQDPRGSAKPWLGLPDTQQKESVDKIRQMVFNPEVTVRMRGVMEKCTYCVQRIRAVQSDRRNRGEEVKDGDVVTACQQVCPTQAIVFGDLNDADSKVSQLHRNGRAYKVLDKDLNTRPRAVHLAKVVNGD